MIKIEENNKTGSFRSLRLALFYSLLIGLSAAVAVFFAIRLGTRSYIEKNYLSEERVQGRTQKYIEDLQRYVDDNALSGDDIDKVADWASKSRYIYVLIYKDDELVFDSGAVEDTEQDTDSPTTGEEDPDAGDIEEEKDNSASGSGGITVELPTREELIKYAADRGSSLLTMGETNLLVSIADYTEYFYYDLANIASIFFAMVTLVLVIMIYFHRVTSRITRLGKDVMVIADGEVSHAISGGGNDEIGLLARDVDRMRKSLVSSVAKEREAMSSNIELITSMSHDIRTPLTVLLGYLDVMKSRTDDPALQEYLSISERTAVRLKNLSDDMFNYFLVFGGELSDTVLEEYQALPLIEQLLSEHLILSYERGYKIDIRYTGTENADVSHLITFIDPVKLARILQNVFSNIYKYADKNEIIVIEIAIMLDKIKLKFTNTVNKDSLVVESSGIGLKTCYKLAEHLGIQFSSGRREDTYEVIVMLDTHNGGGE